MKSWNRDPESHIGIVPILLELSDLPAPEKKTLRLELERYMRLRLDRRLWMHSSITEFHTEWYREVYRIIGVEDPYRELKCRSAAAADQLLRTVQTDGIRGAMLAAIVANRLDFGVFGDLDPKTKLVLQDFANLENLPLFVDDSEILLSRLKGARKLLYLADNHGEVLFDLAFIGKILRINENVTVHLAGKSGPMLNDVTYEELVQLKMPENCTALSTGSNCFGVPESEVSAEFKEELARADVVIAKGHAYLEFWTEYGIDNVFNLATTKFAVRDVMLGEIPKGSSVILWSGRYAEGKPPYNFRGAPGDH